MTAGVTLRRARRGDAPAIAEIHVDTWRDTYAGVVPDRYLIAMTHAGQLAFWQRRIGGNPTGQHLLVAECDGLVTGFVDCGPSRFAKLGFGGEIYALYVAGDWQGRGIGRSLVAGAFERLVADRWRDALVWVLSANPARFFYEALGGRLVGERQEPFAGTLLDETAYGWSDLAGWLAARR
jgi:ribosomal protein S18 acetylase RimI-like enzyme